MQSNYFPPVVHIMLTGHCQLQCPFCFGPSSEIKNIDVNLWIDFLNILSSHGTKVIGISGGEPTLYPGFLELIEAANEMKLKICLSTNCINFDIIEKIIEKIDWIEIPLVGYNNETQFKLYNLKNHFSILTNALEILGKSQSLRIKIGTVVTSTNYNYLSYITNILKRYRIETWKIYEMRPRGRGKLNFRKLHFNFQQHNSFINNFLTLCRKELRGVNIVISRLSSGNNSYLIVDPDGTLLVPRNANYINLGNFNEILIDNSRKEEIINNIFLSISLDKMIYVHNESFPGNL